MTPRELAELELIEVALNRGISWANIARSLHPKMERYEAKRRYRELRRLDQLQRAGVTGDEPG